MVPTSTDPVLEAAGDALAASESATRPLATPCPGEPRVCRPVPPAAALSLRGAGVRFGPRWVWRNVDLSVGNGEFLVVLGPNGAGKTTLLRILLGLLHLGEGEVEVLGRDPRLGRRLIGYVPQRRSMDRDLNVRARDLVSLGVAGASWGLALPTRARRVRRGAVEVVRACRWRIVVVGLEERGAPHA